MSDWDWERKKLGRWRLRFGVPEVCVQRGCGGTSAAKLSLLNPPESGFGTSCCSPRGNGKWDCCKSMFCMKCPITVTSALGDKSLLLVWDLQEENCSLQQHASSLDLIPAPSSLFFPLYQYLWECRETFLYMFEHEFYRTDGTRLCSLCPCDASLLHIFLQLGSVLSQASLAGNGLTSWCITGNCLS